MEKHKLYDNKESKRYEYRIGELRPHIEYRMKSGDIYLTHTRIPEQLRGQGIGKALAEDVLEDIAARNIKLVPLCGFVASYMKKNPQWRRLLKEGIYIG